MPRWASAHSVAAALSLLTIGFSTAQAGTFNLTILVSPDDPAPGSGAGLNQDDGVFTWAPPNIVPDYQFGPPVAAEGGKYAFSAAVQQFINGMPQGIDTGIWGGVQGGDLTMLFRQRLAAPPTGSNFTHYGQQNISEFGAVAFFGNTTAPLPAGGIWWGNSGIGPVSFLRSVQRLDIPAPTLPLLRPLITGNFLAYSFQNTNWNCDMTTMDLRAVSRSGMPVTNYGNGVTLTGPGSIVALANDGRMLLMGLTSDGTNRLFVIDRDGAITPVLSQGDPAPGIPGHRIASMSASGNESGWVSVLASPLDDGDGNFFNNRSALFAGPFSNLTLVAQSPVGVIWGGGTFITKSNYVSGTDPVSGLTGTFRLPASTNEPPTFTPFPAKPYPPLAGEVLLTSSLNAQGQYVELYGNSGSINQKNRGRDLWLFDPGDGWTNIARRGSNVVASGQSIPVNDIGFVGNINFGMSSGAGYATGLADDGVIVFSIGTHILTLGEPAAHDFVWAGLLDQNWHTTTNIEPFSNWVSAEGFPRELPPGDAEPDTATVTIPPGFTVRVVDREASIGAITASGDLTLQQQLTLNRTSIVNNVKLDGTNAALRVNATTFVTNNVDWHSGLILGSGQLLATNLFFTNGLSARLGTTFTVSSNALFDNGGLLVIDGGTFRTYSRLLVRRGMVTNAPGFSLIQNFGLLEKDTDDDFFIYVRFSGYQPENTKNPWGIQVRSGKLGLSRGGNFFDNQTNTISTNSILELRGSFDVGVAGGGVETLFEGDGTLELGSTNQTVTIHLLPQCYLTFNMGSNTAHLNNGSIEGFGIVENRGLLRWHAGEIATVVGETISTAEFRNSGTLMIEPLPESRILARNLDNEGQVVQSGTLTLSGLVRNRRLINGWVIRNAVDLLQGAPSAEFVNEGTFAVLPESPGVANVHVAFGSSGAVECGSASVANPAFTLRFHGEMRDFDPATRTLSRGNWFVGPNCTNDFVGKEVEVIGRSAFIGLFAGDMPTLKLREINGRFSLRDKHYETPGALTNRLRGNLLVAGASVLTVNGNLVSDHETLVRCEPPAIIKVNGDATLDGQAEILGTLEADGEITLDGAFRGSGVLRGAVVSLLDLEIVRASPGILNVVGTFTQTGTSVLLLDLEGTGTDDFDQLIISSNAVLNGTLAIRLPNGYKPSPGDTFEIVRAGSIQGAFANAAHGQRVETIGGFGSLLVEYTPTSVVLSAFQANPNPPPTAAPELQALRFDAFGDITLPLTGSPGRDYILQGSTNLVNWTSIQTNIANHNGVVEFDIPASFEPQRFFRAAPAQ